ncbi:hypothetical protein PR048_033430 [Dryococelus australis]|uniref:Tubulin/FtsZ 2-layer sandwich domain-containing protein n=1 Tax=Dryococelus australis TaxID=614101 RepID=A0ABQ9G1I6_9NEOP|nr:hypothetical protein PR048_033430 [Dryococelus australis]
MCEHLRTGCESAETSRYIATCKPFQDMNSIIVSMLLHLTSGSRFPGPLNVDISDIATNMVPFPGLHFVSSSYAPITLGRRNHEQSVRKDLCIGVLSRYNQLVGLDPWGGVLLGTALVGRGSVSMADMRSYVDRLGMRRRFAPWGTAMKVGLCSVPAAGHSASLLALANSSNMASLFSDVTSQFTKLFHRKAHTHHYLKVEGFDARDFEDSKECLLESVSRYSGMDHIQKVSKPRMQALV